MNKTIKAKWVKALRSGKYRQGSQFLRTSSGAYCCLGVLRSVIDKGSRLSWLCGNAHLDRSHQKISGLTDAEEVILAEMNDTGNTFSQIADYIEKKL